MAEPAATADATQGMRAGCVDMTNPPPHERQRTVVWQRDNREKSTNRDIGRRGRRTFRLQAPSYARRLWSGGQSRGGRRWQLRMLARWAESRVRELRAQGRRRVHHGSWTRTADSTRACPLSNSCRARARFRRRIWSCPCDSAHRRRRPSEPSRGQPTCCLWGQTWAR